MSELPDGWRRLPLEALVCEGPSNGYSPVSGGDAKGTLTLKLSATTTGRFILDESTTKRIHEEVSPESKLWLKPGDILIQRSNTLEYVGTAALFDGPPRKYIYPDLMMRVRARQDVVEPEYLVTALNAPGTRAALRDKATGTAGNMPKINGATVRGVLLDVPPLADQRRIIAKLDSLQSKSRRAKDALDAIPPLLDRFRHSVLAAAFRGDLTAEWRAKNPDVEPASDLLKRIRVERRCAWEKVELAKLKAKGRAPGDDRWKGNYEEPQAVDTPGLPELPDGWAWAALSELVAEGPTNGYSPATEGGTLGTLTLRLSATTSGTCVLTERTTKRVAESIGPASSYWLRSGDLLVQRANTLDYVGTAAVFAGPEQTFIYPDLMMRLRVGPLVDVRHLWRAVNAPMTRKHLRDRATGTAGNMPKINGETLRRCPIPVPPAAEAVFLVDSLDRSFARLDALATLGQELNARLMGLDAVLLSRAFRGQLAPKPAAGEGRGRLATLNRGTSTPDPQR